MLMSTTIRAGAALVDQIPIWRAALGGPHRSSAFESRRSSRLNANIRDNPRRRRSDQPDSYLARRVCRPAPIKCLEGRPSSRLHGNIHDNPRRAGPHRSDPHLGGPAWRAHGSSAFESRRSSRLNTNIRDNPRQRDSDRPDSYLAGRIDQVLLRVAAFGDSRPICATTRGDGALIDYIPIWRAALGGPH
jgi:hypothetical protein